MRASLQAMARRLVFPGLYFTCFLLHAVEPPYGIAPPSIFFQNGDAPVVFLGDSITEQQMYTTCIEAYLLTRFPSWKLTFRNIGWGGDTSWLKCRGNFENGMSRDILPLAPKVIIINYGMNDARGDSHYAKYVEHMTRLARELKAAGIRVALITSNPAESYMEGQPGGDAYNVMLCRFSNAVKEVAAKEGVAFVDQFTPFLGVIEEGRKAGVLGAKGDPRLTSDGTHPNWAGHFVMASSILKGLGATALVSDAEIDAAARMVKSARNCKIELRASTAPDEVKFTRNDDCLPWPVPREAKFVLKVPGFIPLEDLSLYRLKVTGLQAARYELRIDEQVTGTFTKEALAEGINLTMQAGPITAQSCKLFETVMDKNTLFSTRWRNVQLADIPGWLKGPGSDALRSAEMARMDKLIIEKEQAIDALRKTTPHVFVLRPSVEGTTKDLTR